MVRRASVVRASCLVVFAAGIVGMIITNVADDHDGSIAFGMVALIAAVVLIAVTWVVGGPANGRDLADSGRPRADPGRTPRGPRA